ncbi:hypothetical protein L5I01_17410 [Gordonia sp. HY442]|uniref:hypothetical protein n=1 Tax=Gordonia zhenghanii TaxID=2911516 RepID=UPI001F3816E2|nr:hypothetical protein [Gordonia zhenghanii]MCF8605135.1 hypothetical protein [Gordonia zhenghanii]
MTWFKVDDGFWSHPKTAALPPAAISLWVKSGAYSCQHLTDGRISPQVLRLLGTRKSARDLVNAGLWHEVDGGWVFHDWSEYQETSGDVLKRRDEAKERQRRSREERAKKQRESQRKSQGMSHVTEGVSSQEVFYPRPDPTRPDLSSTYVGEGRSPNERANEEPPPRNCEKHIGDPNPPNCHACAQARTQLEAWHAERAAIANENRRAELQAQVEAQRFAIDHCDLCDDDGYRDGRVCDHDPEADERNARGMAEVRAVLAAARRGGGSDE